MKISIITVCLNSAATIEKAIQSVANQTYAAIEYIVIDGASTDETVAIINKYANVVTKLISEPDAGLYDAMNKGIQLATGDVIGFINADDLFCDDKALEKVMLAFENNPDLDAVYADLYYVAENNTNAIIRRWVTGEQKKFSGGWHPAHPTLYIKKEVYANYGLFKLDFKLAADFEIMLRFFEKHHIKAHYLKQAIVKMRLGGATNKSLKNIYKQNVECLRAFKINGIRVNAVAYPFLRLIPKFLQFKKA